MQTLNFPCLAAVCLGLSLMVFAPGADALDDRRTGFILGFGGGFQRTAIDYNSDDVFNNEEAEGSANGNGLILQLSIGGAFTDQFAVTGTHQYMGFGLGDDENLRFLLGVTGTYWFRPSRPSPYVAVTFGRQVVDSDTLDRVIFRSSTGDAIRLAVGFEFANRVHVEGGVVIGGQGSFNRDDSRFDTIATQVTASYVWY